VSIYSVIKLLAISVSSFLLQRYKIILIFYFFAHISYADYRISSFEGYLSLLMGKLTN
jgi:hypothetical protein